VENIDMIRDLVSKIRKEVKKNGLLSPAVSDSLTKMRAYAIQDESPKLTKTIRLVLEHLEAQSKFLIPIPSDEEILDEEGEAVLESIEYSGSDAEQLESFNYLLDLFNDYKRPSSIEDLELYKQALLNF
jgi:hypothetical protein